MTEGPSGKYMFGVCKVNAKGQIVIPKEARDIFNIKEGDSLVLLGDINQGLALIKADVMAKLTDMIINGKKD